MLGTPELADVRAVEIQLRDKTVYYRRTEKHTLVLSVVRVGIVDGDPSRQIADARILCLNRVHIPETPLVQRHIEKETKVKLEVVVGVVVMLEHVAWETRLFNPLLRPLLAWRGPRDIHPLFLWDHPTTDGVFDGGLCLLHFL